MSPEAHAANRRVTPLKRKTVRPKKRLGQNFLYDPAIAGRIARATGASPGDVVVELGAGHGILSRALLELGVRLIAVEVDRDLAGELRGVLEEAAPPDVPAELIRGDFTRLSLRGLLEERGLGPRCVLVGNIPYYLTRDVLFGFLVDEHQAVARAVVMVQREVGERIVSPPGNRVYGITSVVLQSLYEVEVVTKVAPGSFHPRPKVASLVLAFTPLAQPRLAAGGIEAFLGLVKNLFQQRRKTIHNTLRASYSLSGEQLEALQAATGVDLTARPEALDQEAFHRLAEGLAEVTR